MLDRNLAVLLSRLAGLLGQAVPAHRFGMMSRTSDGLMVDNLNREERLKAWWLARFPTAEIEAVEPKNFKPSDYPMLWVGAEAEQVLLVRGHTAQGDGALGRNWLAEQLELSGAAVGSVEVYERRAPQFSYEQRQRMRQASQDGSLWLFSSSQAISHLPADLDWRAARALATHPRIAQAARVAGFVEVIQSRPALPEVLVSIKLAFHE